MNAFLIYRWEISIHGNGFQILNHFITVIIQNFKYSLAYSSNHL